MKKISVLYLFFFLGFHPLGPLFGISRRVSPVSKNYRTGIICTYILHREGKGREGKGKGREGKGRCSAVLIPKDAEIKKEGKTGNA